MSTLPYFRFTCGFCGAVWLAAVWLLGAPPAHAQAEGICARVVIRIEQELTLEREGFEARLGISNGLPSALEDFRVTLKFTDSQGNPVAVVTDGQTNVNAKFFYRVQTGYTQPGSVPAGAAPQVAYLIVPAPGAAGTGAAGTLYRVGATIKYRVAGEEQTVEIDPDTITVRPMPDLQLQYFLPTDVYGDDPFTSAIEPEVPFALGVRVANHSAYATARKVAIQSGQPEIVENEQGLLIDFRIIGAQVNGGSAQATLQTNFGDIGPLRSAVGNWLMTVSLSGKFVKFSAEVAHAPEFGGALTSLIPEDAISAHRLLGQVLVDLPGRDAINDFLAVDAMTGAISGVKIYESDNDQVSSPVEYYAPESGAATLTSTGTADTHRLSLQPAGSLVYVRLPSPLAADKAIRAVRSDDKVLPAANAWVSKAKNDALKWVYTVNLFDTDRASGLSYTLTFTDPPQNNRPPVLTLAAGRTYAVAPGKLLSIPVSGTDPDGRFPVLTTGALPDGATFADAKNGTGLFTWTPTPGQLGTYTVQFRASDGTLSDSLSARIEVGTTVVTGLSAWRERYWPGVSDPAIVGNAADPDGDGLDNLLEYALDADPTRTDDSVLPVIGTAEAAGQSYLTLTYRHRTDDPLLTYEVVASENLYAPLAAWTVQTTVPTVTPPASGETVERVSVRDSQPIAETGPRHRYLRLRVSLSETEAMP